MANQQATGLRRVANAWKFSLLGFKAAYREEEAFRQEFWVALFLMPLGFYLGNGALEQILLVGSLLLLLLVELLNSAIEAVVDRFGGEIHPLSGRAKDMGSAAVFIAVMIAGLVWGRILWAHFL